MKGKHLFILDRATIDSVSDETVRDTVADLKELGLYRLPYPRVSVRMPTAATTCTDTQPGDFLQEYVLKANRSQHDIHFQRDKNGRWRPNLSDAHCIELRNLNLDGERSEIWMVHEGGDPKWRPYELHARPDEYDARSSRDTINLLITLLATKNILKNTHHNTLAKHGVGCKRPGSTKGFEYVTTISVPPEMGDDEEHPPLNGAKAPHLRRGHIRRQHYGPRNAFIKKVWIEPCFVNADPSFVSTRRAYNVAL